MWAAAMVAFLDIKVRDAADRLGTDVGVSLRLDLAGAADDLGQVLARNFPGHHFGCGSLAFDDGECDNSAKNDHNSEDE